MRIRAKLLLVAAVALLAAACGGGGDDGTRVETPFGDVRQSDVFEELDAAEIGDNGSYPADEVEAAARRLAVEQAAADPDRVLFSAGDETVTVGDVLTELDNPAPENIDPVQFEIVLGDLTEAAELSVLANDPDFVAARAGDTEVTGAQLFATFTDEGRDVATLRRADVVARLTSILSLITFEEAFVAEGFLTEVPTGDFRARGQQLDALATSQGVRDRAVEWFENEATGIAVLEAQYCLTFFVTSDEGRADAAVESLAGGASFDSLISVVEQGDQFGDDCSTLLNFPDDLAATILDLEDGGYSELITLDGSNGPSSFILARRINREREEQPYLKEIVLQVEVEVDPRIGEWNPETRAVQYDPTS